MGNSKFNITKEAKDIIDSMKVILEIDDTPTIIKLALAKGVAICDPSITIEKVNGDGYWLVPENIIRDKDYLLFKHLIINEYKTIISDQEINKYFAFLIEQGAKELKKIEQNKTSFEDLHVAILS